MSYGTIHTWLRDHASYGSCKAERVGLSPCKNLASEWALKPDKATGLDPALNVPFSDNPGDYIDLCESCHRQLDSHRKEIYGKAALEEFQNNLPKIQKQPTRSKRITAERRFDRTQLRINGHGRTVHRDYLAHVLRWHFVVDQLNYVQDLALKYGWVHRQIDQGMSILDIGCGQDQPLLYVLGARIQTVPEVYVGVDLNPIRNKSRVRWADIHDQFDFVNNYKKLDELYTPFDVCVCFEVIEHMSPEDGAKMLEGIRFLLKPGGLLYLSTPVFDGLAAANHLHEYTIPELRTAIETAGFEVKERYGTFASKPDIKPKLSAAEADIYNRLEKWFGGEILACFLAPLYPDASRNNLWVCQKPSQDSSRDSVEPAIS